MAERVLLGAVIGAHGLKGEVRVKTFTSDPDALGAYGPLTTNDGRRLAVVALRAGKLGEVVVRFDSVADRDAAEALKGRELFVPRAALPKPEADEFYHADLIGLCAVTADGAEIGTVAAVHDFGAGDILELQPKAGGSTIMVPFTAAFVPSVDIAGGRIVVAPLEDAPGNRGSE